ncbi:MAG: hypothetical protein ACW99A_15700, partial [Candidatus Kariarchaeaceae archaeon]
STVSIKKWPQSTGILFGSLMKGQMLKIYVLTEKNYVKVKNIKENKHISFLIPFPHYWLRMAPSFTIHFQCVAKLLPTTDKNGIDSHKGKRVLQMSLKELENEKYRDNLTFIEITPYKKLHSYGMGFSLVESLRKPHELAYSVPIPNE